MKKIVVVIILLFVCGYAHALPSFDEVKKSYRKSDAVLLDRHGKGIHELRVDAKGRRLEWTSLKNVSPALITAVLHTEDKRFYEHHGVDWKAAGAAAIKNIFSGGQRGASTITMQLAAMLDKELKPKAKKRSMGQKWDQMQAARELEAAWRKDDILEAYLNLVTFRGEFQGIASASRGLFEKDASGLDEQESMLLASLIRSPNASPDAVAKRACLLSASLDLKTACDALKALAAKTLIGPYRVRQRTGLAPHVAHTLLKNGMTSAASTLDGGLQRVASDTLTYHLAAVRKQNVHDGAVLVVDNRSGDLLAYVANNGDLSTARHVNGIIARRQAGSTLKPFLYGLAFDRQVLRPSSLLVDSPLDVPTVFGVYRPENYDNDFKGPVHARVACFYQPADYLHLPPQLPDGTLQREFDIHVVRDVAAARDLLGLGRGRHAFVGEWQPEFEGWNFAAVNPQPVLAQLHYARAAKTAYEVACMREASRLAARGHLAARDTFLTGGSEYEAHMAYCAAAGVREEELPYGNIVAYNEGGAVLHYQALDRRRGGPRRSFLIDAGAQFRGYASDITRTWSGGDAEFAGLVDAMDALQRRMCAAIRRGRDFREVHLEAHRQVGALLADAGIVRCDAATAYPQ